MVKPIERWIRRRPHRLEFLADRSGSAAVEFALVATPFIAILFAMIETFLVFFAQQHLDSITYAASREILTGQAQSTQMTQSQFAQLVCSKVRVLFSCNNLMIDVEAYTTFSSGSTSAPTLTFDSNGQVTNSWQYNPGSPGQIVIVRVMYQWPVFVGSLGFNLSDLANGNHLLMATAAFKNEP